MLSFILFIFILGVIVLVHEFGHYLFAKIFKVYVYEFSIGMGKRLWYYKKKGGETEYSIRLIPLGGYCSLAGEEVDEADAKKIPKNRRLQDKKVWQRFLIMFAGAGFNFVLAFVLLFVSALIFGSVTTKPVLGSVPEGLPAYEAGLRVGDTILEVDGDKVSAWDDVMWDVQMSDGSTLTFVVEDVDGNEKTVNVTPDKEETEDGTVTYKFGLGLDTTPQYGLGVSFQYAINKTGSLFRIMFETLKSLFTGQVGVTDLSGPVGIYSVVDSQAKAGVDSILYLIAFLSLNVGVINLIPLPAFDGGRILFLIIEKIKGSPVSSKVENTIHNIGFLLLIGLMILVTFSDIFKLFN